MLREQFLRNSQQGHQSSLGLLDKQLLAQQMPLEMEMRLELGMHSHSAQVSQQESIDPYPTPTSCLI
jgi:hypothetical protein